MSGNGQTEAKICKNCLAWRPKKELPEHVQFSGGCARSGETTTRFGDPGFNLYTTDLGSCSGFISRGK